MRIQFRSLSLILFLGGASLLTSCNPNAPTFPQELLKKHIQEICFSDYGIENVDVAIAGKTLGVHLPLKKLFSNDIQALMASGKIKSVESLLELSPDAIEKIQDVMFTTSRVLISSDSEIEFYILKATDYEGTGIEFILANYLEDVKRVRFWDIPLSEYYKRSFRDMKMNRSIFLKRPVLELFDSVGTMKLPEIFKRYFTSKSTLRDISPFFYTILLEYEFKRDVKISLLNSKAKAFKADEVLVYMKVKETYEAAPSAREHKFIYLSGTVLEYIFILKPVKSGLKIYRVLPFNYIDPEGNIKKIEFPESLRLYQNIEEWSGDFEVEEIIKGEFIAEQTGRRAMAKIYQDEELVEELEKAAVKMQYISLPGTILEESREGEEEKPSLLAIFQLELELKLRTLTALPEDPGFMEEPLVKRTLQIVLQKARKVFYGYAFKDYEFINFHVTGSPYRYQISPSQLEEFRKKDPNISEILEVARVT